MPNLVRHASGMYAANSLFIGDYLTTKGQAPEADYKMIEDMGFTVTKGEEAGIRFAAMEEAPAKPNCVKLE